MLPRRLRGEQQWHRRTVEQCLGACRLVLRGHGIAGRQRDEAAGHRGIAGHAAARRAAAPPMARPAQQTADQRDQPRQHRESGDQHNRQNRCGGVDLPALPGDLDAPGVVGGKADNCHDRRDDQESDEAAHQRAAPSRATSNPSIWRKADSTARH